MKKHKMNIKKNISPKKKRKETPIRRRSLKPRASKSKGKALLKKVLCGGRKRKSPSKSSEKKRDCA